MSDEDRVAAFWKQKEEENNSKLISKTVAEYKQEDKNRLVHVTGLLYLMGNGFYFETFEKNNFFSSLMNKNNDFKKINIHMIFTRGSSWI